MTDPQIRFDDGAAYERIMGIWSQLAGEQFLDWLAQPAVSAGSTSVAAMELLLS